MRKLLPLVVLFFTGHYVHAQPNHELNSLIVGSFNYFPRIKELNKSAELSELRIEIAQTGYLPQVSGVASYTYVNPISELNFPVAPGEIKLLKFQPYNNYNFNIGVNQLLWDFGKTKAQVEKAKADLLTSKQNIEGAKLQLAAQVAGIYYSLIYLKKAVQVQDSVIATYAENLKIVEGKIRQGDALQVDLSTIKNNIDQEENRKVEFLRQYDRQMALMRYSAGQDVTPAIAQFDFNPTTGSDIANNPDVLAANERIAASRADVKYAQSNKLPTLNFQGGAGFKNGYQPNIEVNRFNYLAGATLAVPIFQGGRIAKNQVLATRTAELNELSKATLASTLQKDLESSLSDVKAYDMQIKNSDGQIDVAEETMRLTQVRYRQGVATYLDLINASANLQRAYLNRIQYEYQRVLSQVEICRIVGAKFWQE